ncbi:EmrB/QacA family drug resistance transporter [Tsuneonella deserti]|uniref:EmrB/QacA family drug resistance transporter n=1 Tax=Tsuneonella deserti TaxID=2035528 RepID=A0ABQ1S4R1_9SPHN|nr:MDR family MFS transporter [Tsuneonella deserti]GGD90947.1 EmrB/QacA family drug resistance transporter [Tsuneonella deserti]
MASAAAPAGRNAAPPVAPAVDRPQLPVRNQPLLLVGIMAASLLQILDTTIANVAIPHMQSSLGATADTVTWVLTSYIIASAVAMPITGWLADRVGARRLFILSVAGFIVASMLCGMAQNLEEMVIFRALQGVAGAFIPPLSQSFMLDTSRPSRHAQVMAIWGMGIMIGPIAGPILGGWLTESANWRWVFYVNLPFGMLALAILLAELPHRDATPRRFDLFGFALLGLALASLQLMLDRGNQLDWFESGEIWVYAFVCLSAAWAVVVHLATASKPLFDKALFGDRNFALALGFMVAIGVVMFANMALMPPMLQRLFGYSVIDTGLVLMPRGVGVLVSMQLSGLMMRRGADARFIVGTGFLITAFSQYQMAHWSLAADVWHFVIAGLIQGLGMGLVFIPLNVTAFSTLPPRLRTDGSSLLNLARSLGASVGISITTILLASNLQRSHEEIGGHLTSASIGAIDLATIDRYQSAADVVMRMLDNEVNRQAAMIAYIDDFYLMMWLALAAVPLTVFMRKSRQQAGSAPPPMEH